MDLLQLLTRLEIRFHCKSFLIAIKQKANIWKRLFCRVFFHHYCLKIGSQHSCKSLNQQLGRYGSEIILLWYNVGIQSVLYTKTVILYATKDTEICTYKIVMQIYQIAFTPNHRCNVIYNQYIYSLCEIQKRLYAYASINSD